MNRGEAFHVTDIKPQESRSCISSYFIYGHLTALAIKLHAKRWRSDVEQLETMVASLKAAAVKNDRKDFLLRRAI
jgi:hypothetical protein